MLHNPPPQVTGPLSRFGDTASNVGALALLDNSAGTKNLPIPVKTMVASGAAAAFRVLITPVDTLKTTMQDKRGEREPDTGVEQGIRHTGMVEQEMS